MRKMYESDPLYMMLRPYVDMVTRASYRRCSVSGVENIPEDGAVILAPNHCNALMDPLVILRSRKGPTVFGARADAFTPRFAGILSFLKIVPMVRKRDGLRNVLKNVETIDRVAEILQHGVPFCIFSEGTHRTMHSLMPLTKGIFRVAAEVYSRDGGKRLENVDGGKRTVYIVPVGLEYGDYSRFRSTVQLTFGRPMEVSSVIREMEGEPEAHIYAELRNRLDSGMRELITCLDDDADYDARWVTVKTAAAGQSPCSLKEKQSSCSLKGKMERNRRIAAALSCYEKEHPEKAAELFMQAREFESFRLKAGVSYHSLGHRMPRMRILLKTLAALAGLPYFAASAIASFPMWATAEKIRMGVDDKAFWNTVRFATCLAMLPFMAVIWALLSFFLLPWYLALPVFLLCLPTYWYVHDYTGFVRILLSDVRLASDRSFRKKAGDFRQTIDNCLTQFNPTV